MRNKYFILILCFLLGLSSAEARTIHFNFYGDTIDLNWDPGISDNEDTQMTEAHIISIADHLGASDYQPLIARMLAYKEQKHLDDWFYYQLIRKTAEQISPKARNYDQYTIVKWFLLSRSHYDATLALSNNILLFYVRSNDNIYDIPSYSKDNVQYVCLNYHDYGSKIDFATHAFHEIYMPVPEAAGAFSYRVTHMPDFKASDYAEKDIKFRYRRRNYDFKVKVNPEVKNIFVNYPVVDYDAYFNIPISRNTYNSFVPALKKAVKGMTQKKGVDYLMRFTRYSFAYESDQDAFGKEKRFSPEQTLLSEYSDCDDRAALFFYLVKEIYNLPMIVLLYPEHVTIAVRFDKMGHKGILYNNMRYEVCEPTPQSENLKVGDVASHLKHTPYHIAYEYHP